ncbi:transglycosylase domain-containing protein [Candidatus Dojkabacteria bacterium]|nr:transglycosylase domain-containing protein [Candidatus Dojkabacteria bacterium]
MKNKLKIKLTIKKQKLLLLLGLLFIAILIITPSFITVIKKSDAVIKQVYDRNGEILYATNIAEGSDENYIKLSQIHPDFIDSFILMEDKNFYSNAGIDFPRLLKCTISAFKKDKTVCGASTITMQYIKLKLNNNQRSIFNKVEELMLSPLVTVALGKNEILERYLNLLYFSNLRYGVESSAQGYFGKKNTDLDTAQVTFLASIPNSPKKLDPYTNFEEVKQRQKIILNMMLEKGRITEEEFRYFRSLEIELKNNPVKINAPHFVNMVLENNAVNAATELYTTLDLSLYKKISEIVDKKFEEIEKYHVSNSAVIVMDADSGEVLSFNGSRDYYNQEIGGQVNAALALRNPGSTLKPFTYSLGLEKDMTAATLINDVEQTITSSDGKDYFPKNYDEKEHGMVTVREALANSFNIPAVLTLNHVGVDRLYELSDNIGLEEIRGQKADIAATLGGTSINLLDIVNAYRIFPNQGNYHSSIKFLKEQGDKDKILEGVFGKDSREIAFIISDILADNEARRESFGTLSNLNLPFKVSAKTGTAQDFRDSWTIGYTKDYVVGVWVGNNDNTPMDGINGVQGAGKIWNEVVQLVENYYEINSIKDNKAVSSDQLNLKKYNICRTTLNIVDENCKSLVSSEYFILGKEPGDKILRTLAVAEPAKISIIDPFDGDEYVYEEGLRFPILYQLNQEYQEIQLIINGEKVSSTIDQEKIFWEPKVGEYQVKIVAKSVTKHEESKSIEIKVVK